MSNLPMKFQNGREKARSLRAAMEHVITHKTIEPDKLEMPQWRFEINPVTQKEVEQRFFFVRELIEERQRFISELENQVRVLKYKVNPANWLNIIWCTLIKKQQWWNL